MKNLLIIISILAIAMPVWAGGGLLVGSSDPSKSQTIEQNAHILALEAKLAKQEKSCRWEYEVIFHNSIMEPPMILKNKGNGMIMDSSWELFEIISCFKNSDNIGPGNWAYFWFKRRVCE